jgi:DNA-binding IclR family transcriptional regulator
MARGRVAGKASGAAQAEGSRGSAMTIQSVAHTLRIVEALSASDYPLGVTDIATALGVTKALAFRHLRGLVELGYIEQDRLSGKYRLNVRLFLLGRTVVEGLPLHAVGRPVLRELARSAGQNATISCLDNDQPVVVAMELSDSPLGFSTRPGIVLSPHATAPGKVMLAFGPESYREAVLSAPLTRFTDHTIVDRADLERELERIVWQGWAQSAEEFLLGTNIVAAPIFDPRGKLAGSVALLGSVHFLKSPPPLDMLNKLLDAAAQITHGLAEKGRAADPVDS